MTEMKLMDEGEADHREPVSLGRGQGELPIGFRQRVI